MSAVRVAIPVFRAKRRFHLLKGRPWSSAEHLVLQSLVKTPRTAGALSDASKLPRRVVIEILIRLMKVGWVEVSPDPEGVVFRATVSGTARAADLELPSPMKSAKRWMAFFVDRVTGTAYRGREFQAFPKSRLIEKSKQEIVVWLQPDNDRFEVEPNALFSNLISMRLLPFETRISKGCRRAPLLSFQGRY
jgi:cardiolipin synthase A/B